MISRPTIYRLFKTSAFRLTATYLVVFLAFSISGLYYFSWQARTVISDYIINSIEKETDTLAMTLRNKGLNALNRDIQRRIANKSDYFYLLTTFNGFVLSTNMEAIPMEVAFHEGWYEGHYFRYASRNVWLTEDLRKELSVSPWAHLIDPNKTPLEYQESMNKTGEANLDMEPMKIHLTLAKVTELDGGLKLFVASNADELIRLDAAARRSRGTALILMILFGVLSGIYSVRRMLKRVDKISTAMDDIAAGKLSQRLPLSGSGDELDRVAERVNAMLARIESLMQGLQEVSDNIAHDLKTPLTRIHNQVEQALHMDNVNDELKDVLGDVLHESDQLIKVFEALLQIARVEAGHADVPFDEINISTLVADMGELYEPLIEEEGMTIEVKCEENLKACINRELLGQALANLIENAIKYGTKPGTMLTLNARTVKNGLEISVADQGEGIDESDRKRVMTRFTRLNESRSTPGSGLGLSLVSAVAHFHGGTVELRDNNPGLNVVMFLSSRCMKTQSSEPSS